MCRALHQTKNCSITQILTHLHVLQKCSSSQKLGDPAPQKMYNKRKLVFKVLTKQKKKNQIQSAAHP